jgi:primosomal protein N' (replication factor Y)
MADPLILEVAVAAPLMGLFDYLAPADTDVELRPGMRVRVPFGRGTRVGLLMGLKSGSDLPASRLRRIESVLDQEPLLPDDLQRLLSWASAYYQHPPGEVFATAIPLALREGRGTSEGETACGLTPAGRAADATLLKRAPAQWRAFQLLRDAQGPVPAEQLDTLGPTWRRAINALITRGWVAGSRLAPVLEPVPATADDPPALTPGQSRRGRHHGHAGYRCFLLDGAPAAARPRSTCAASGNVWMPAGSAWCWCRRSA